MGDVVSKWIDVISGVPQGSVLGPLLFLININDLPEVISNVSKLYADDNKIMAVVKNTEDRDNFQHDLNSLNEWCNKWLIKLNLDKCKIMNIDNMVSFIKF
jgi:ribonuclease P/MRP protein subunit RPP40